MPLFDKKNEKYCLNNKKHHWQSFLVMVKKMYPSMLIFKSQYWKTGLILFLMINFVIVK